MIVLTISVAPQTTMATIGISQIPKSSIDRMSSSSSPADQTFDRRLNSGGADRDRTGGLLVANQALSQLSYSPTIKWWAWVELNYRPHPYQGCALAN